MYDQPDITPVTAVALADHTHMFYHGVSPALGDHVHGLGQIDQALDRTHCHTMVHRNDYRLAGYPVHDPFFADFLTSTHFSILPFSEYSQTTNLQ
jgi:hypothetical protein